MKGSLMAKSRRTLRALGIGVAAITMSGALVACGGTLSTAKGSENCDMQYRARFATNYQPNTAINAFGSRI